MMALAPGQGQDHATGYSVYVCWGGGGLWYHLNLFAPN